MQSVLTYKDKKEALKVTSCIVWLHTKISAYCLLLNFSLVLPAYKEMSECPLFTRLDSAANTVICNFAF